MPILRIMDISRPHPLGSVRAHAHFSKKLLGLEVSSFVLRSCRTIKQPTTLQPPFSKMVTQVQFAHNLTHSPVHWACQERLKTQWLDFPQQFIHCVVTVFSWKVGIAQLHPRVGKSAAWISSGDVTPSQRLLQSATILVHSDKLLFFPVSRRVDFLSHSLMFNHLTTIWFPFIFCTLETYSYIFLYRLI